MKGIRNKILTIGMAAMLAGSCFGMAGCTDNYDRTNAKYNDIWLDNSYIVVSENGIDTLHKGTVYTKQTSAMTSPIFLKFNCGKELQTSQYVAYPQTRPDANKYDEVCECAYEWISENN